MTKASAPGKIILFGEHAVVYLHPALAAPVTQIQTSVDVTDGSKGIWIDAPDVGLHNNLSELSPEQPLRCVIDSVFQAIGIQNPPALNIRISSSIPVASGLGSGAAVSVALIRAISAHVGASLTNQQINQLCFEIEKIHHGTPSGIDNTVITYGQPIYFIKGQPIESLKVKLPFTIVIANSGIQAPTKESVGDVRKLWQSDPKYWEQVFERAGKITLQARQSIESGKWQELGTLMNANHALLQEMTVSSPELDRLVLAARNSGALGAKLSGGGRGGNMIALVRPDNAHQVETALLSAGAKQAFATTIQ